MKAKMLTLGLLSVMVAAFAPSMASAQVVPETPIILFEGVGPAIAGSVNFDQLPTEARDFLKKHFKEGKVINCEREFDDNTYEVTMSDRMEIEFDSKGQWIEIDAFGRSVIPYDLVKKLLPGDAHRDIERRGLQQSVETIKRSVNGYKVEFQSADIDDIRYSTHGKVLSVDRD